jgi:16S rRNA (adenine1518-N6/adenine1519-N6)-dimethyltransferase
VTSEHKNDSPSSEINFDPATRSATRAILESIGASPNRTLGQNFLTDKNALDRIIALADLHEDDSVLEIGPGLGALTCRLVQSAGQVVAIEKDKNLAQFLPSQFLQSHTAARFSLIEGDALQADWSALGLPQENVKIVANLPYSISKPFLRRVYEEWRPQLATATLMLQKEVAQRLVAAPSTPAYGPMAIMAALYGETKIAFHLAPGAFWPPPEVSSSVVHIRLLQAPAIALEDENFFWQVVRAAFGQRRKQLINTLRAAVPDKGVLQSALEASAIDPQRRGETLSLPEFATLSKNLKSKI